MRGRYNSADAVQAAKNQVPLIICKSLKQMDKGRNGARYFRNPPQPHMCIQDYFEETNEPCFINVLSWVKISTPRKPEDPIPLYGGMRVPHNSSAALSLSYHFGSKNQPVIFAVMANPEILRLSGKTAEDPSDRDALVELMIDFVEAMNPDVRFKREFTVLRDRDLAGELKDIWLAVQAKRERERGENGRRGEGDKIREGKDVWREEVRQKALRDMDREDTGISSPVLTQNNEKIGRILQDRNSREERPIKKIESRTCEFDERSCKSAGEMSSVYLSSVAHLTTPSTETLNDIQQIGAIDYEEEAMYSLIRSHYEQENSMLESSSVSTKVHSKQSIEKKFSKAYSSSDADSLSKESSTNVMFPCCNSNLDEESVFSCEACEASSVAQGGIEATDPGINDCSCSTHDHYIEYEKTAGSMVPCPDDASIRDTARISKSQDGDYLPIVGKSNVENTSSTSSGHNSSPKEESISSDHTDETILVNSKDQVPNLNSRSHENLLPGVTDTASVKFNVGTDHNRVAIP